MHRSFATSTVCRTAFALLTAFLVAAPPRAAADVFIFPSLTPDNWTPGQPGSTVSEWVHFGAASPRHPDSLRLPTPGNNSTLSTASPAFRTGSGNFYSFRGDYTVTAQITAPAAVTGSGTHLIVQIANSMSPYGGTSNLQQVVRADGSALAAPAQLLRRDVVAEGVTDSPVGPTTAEQYIWEYFLAGHTDGLRVVWTQANHSSTWAVRIDTMTANQAYTVTVVPEPASLALVGVAGLTALAGRRRR